MKKIVVLFFFSFLSSGKLEVVRDDNPVVQPNYSGMLPVVEEHIWPKQAYLTYKSDEYDKDRASTAAKPCSNASDNQEDQLTLVVPSPTRRSSASESEKSPLTDFQANLQYRDNQMRRVYIEPTTQSPEVTRDENIENEVRINQQNINLTPTEAISDENYENTPQINVIPLDREREAPDVEAAKPESYKHHVSKNQLTTSPPVVVELPVRQTDVQCSEKQKSNTATEPPRRYIINANNMLKKNSVTRTNGNTYSSNVFRSGNNNMADESRNQNAELLNLSGKQAVGSVRTNNNEQNTDASSYKPADKVVGRTGRIHYILKGNGNNNLIDPTKGNGISYVTKSTRMMLMDFDRVCYACSSANNPNCISPDRRTPVKYCRKGDNACVVKSFGSGNKQRLTERCGHIQGLLFINVTKPPMYQPKTSTAEHGPPSRIATTIAPMPQGTLTFVRDCGKTCDDAQIPGLIPKYKTCSMCHSDLCNSAYSINVHTLILIIPTIVSVAVIKTLF